MVFVLGINYGESTYICQGRGFGTLLFFSKASDYTQPKSKGNLGLILSLRTGILSSLFSAYPHPIHFSRKESPPLKYCSGLPRFPLPLLPQPFSWAHLSTPVPPCVTVVVHNHTRSPWEGRKGIGVALTHRIQAGWLTQNNDSLLNIQVKLCWLSKLFPVLALLLCGARVFISCL